MPAPRIASRSTRPASASRYGDARSSVSTAPPAFLGTGRSREWALASHVAGVALPPNEDFTFTPFQSGGLCDAVMARPALRPREATCHEAQGVGTGRSDRRTRKPCEARNAALSAASSGERKRVSNTTGSVHGSPGSRFVSSIVHAAAAVTTRRTLSNVRSRAIRPRQPSVPKTMGARSMGPHGDERNFAFLHAELGIAVAVVLGRVIARIIVALIHADVSRAGQRGVQTGVGLLKVIVRQRSHAGVDLVFLFDAEDGVRVQTATGGRSVACRRLARTGSEGRFVVGQNQRVLFFALLEEVENAFVFEQPRDEVEIGLAVLDTVVPGLIAGLQAQLVILEAPVFENLFDDVGHGLVLEDAAIGVEGEEPEPWH